MDNGLPSNHVYCVTVDRLGYMWLGTPNWVVKYNGYECKIFDQENGLPNEDVWQLLEDDKGRMWLGNISSEIGYIKDDKYHKAYIDNKNRTIRPDKLVKYEGGIAFTSPFLDVALTS